MEKPEVKIIGKCIGDCGREFGIGDWECAPGIKHKVQPRTFYTLDAPTLDKEDKRGIAFRNARTMVENCPPERTVKGDSGELTKVPGGNVLFVRGRATVDDPEKIYWLEKHGHGTNTEEQWKRVYLTPLEKQELREIESRNKEHEADRKLKEANELLDRVKAQTKGKVPEPVGA
jgi:hypothetical protein